MPPPAPDASAQAGWLRLLHAVRAVELRDEMISADNDLAASSRPVQRSLERGTARRRAARTD